MHPDAACRPADATTRPAFSPPAARLDRRTFLSRAGRGVAATSLLGALGHTARAAAPPRPRVCAVLTEFTYRSHAHVILENFLKPYLFNGQRTESGMDVVSFYVDQFPERDMAREVAREFDIAIYPTIGEALTAGGDELAVDGVLSIGEHGQYPYNEKGQHLYPRKRFFDEIVATFRRTGRSVPVFSDKHLSYRGDWALEMVETAREMGFPLMAGSSVPLAQRRPPLELPAGVELIEAVSIHGGGVESYDFHALEVLASQVEARRGGESGIAALQFLSGAALWQAASEGRWSIELAEAAMAAELGERRPLRELVRELKGDENALHGILVEYRDGLRGTMLKVGDSGIRWNFACRVEGESAPRATSYYVGPWQNRNLFKALSHAIQSHIREGRAPYPVERTLLVTGALDAAMDSRYRGEVRLDTPQLDVAYQPVDFRAMREMGATWQIITEAMPEPPGIDTGLREG